MVLHRLVVALWCLLLLPVAGAARTAVSGSIAGIVRDTSGAVLPGVTVEAASPALIEKNRTTVTDDQGRYRISEGDTTSSWSIHGGRPDDMMPTVDGMRINRAMGPGGGFRVFAVNNASVQEMTFQTSGISAESETGGVQVNIVPREGGNVFSGYGATSYSNSAMQSNNVSDELLARGLSAEVAGQLEIQRIKHDVRRSPAAARSATEPQLRDGAKPSARHVRGVQRLERQLDAGEQRDLRRSLVGNLSRS